MLQGLGPAADVTDGLEAHRDVADDEGDAIPLSSTMPCRSRHRLVNMTSAVRLVELVVPHGKHGEDALGCGNRVPSAKVAVRGRT